MRKEVVFRVLVEDCGRLLLPEEGRKVSSFPLTVTGWSWPQSVALVPVYRVWSADWYGVKVQPSHGVQPQDV
jgi:hypothetical protein